MGNTDRPVLTLEQELVIETAQNKVDEMFWLSLWVFQASMHYGEDEYNPRRNKLNPPAPKEPVKFRWVVSEYARNLFIVESQVYPGAPQLRKWLEDLSERVVERVSQTLNKIEEQGALQSRSFTHHGVTPDEILSTMRDALAGTIKQRLAPPLPFSPPPPPPEVQEQMRASPTRHQLNEKENRATRRKAVVEPLLAKNGWSIFEWATNSDVAFHTADDYLKGKRTPYPSTIKKLAESLGLSVQQLPQ
ncbi:MAG: hypothetical protein WCA10_19785 [Terracidiphilus sp.]